MSDRQTGSNSQALMPYPRAAVSGLRSRQAFIRRLRSAALLAFSCGLVPCSFSVAAIVTAVASGAEQTLLIFEQPTQQTPPPTSPKDDPELADPKPSTKPAPQDSPRAPSSPVAQPPAPPAKVDPAPAASPQSSIASVPLLPTNSVSGAFPAATSLPEGTFVIDRVGKVVVAETGDVIFVPVAESAAAGQPLMVLLPSQRLEQMLASRAVNGEEVSFRIAGQVFTYRDRAFLLPSMFAVQQQPNLITPEQPKPAKDQSSVGLSTGDGGLASVPRASALRDPQVTELIRELEGQRAGGSEPRRLSATVAPTLPNAVAPVVLAPIVPATGEPAPGSDQRLIANEGTLLVSKRGRIVRLPQDGGRLAFTVDNDANSPAPAPMILQPCRVMQQIEGVAATKGDGVTYRVSGRIMVSGGRNYLLPTFFQLFPKSDITPRQ